MKTNFHPAWIDQHQNPWLYWHHYQLNMQTDASTRFDSHRLSIRRRYLCAGVALFILSALAVWAVCLLISIV